jgi:hypothetical protein
MERIYDTYLTDHQHLSPDVFKKECLSTATFLETSGFGKMAALLVYVAPSNVSHCQGWFVERVKIQQRFQKAEEKELADIIKYIWRNETLPRPLKLDFTIEAVRRLDKEMKQALCLALYEAYPWDSWIETYLPKPPGVDLTAPRPRAKPLPEINLECLNSMGSTSQCRLCSLRPTDNLLLSLSLKLSKSVLRQAQCCPSCRHRTLKLGLVSNAVSVENQDRTLRDVIVLSNSC